MKPQIRSCLKRLKELECDSFLLSDAVNIEYLTSFTGAEGYLLVSSNQKPIYFTSFLYLAKAQALKDWKVIATDIRNNSENIFDLIAEQVKKLKPNRLGFEAKKLPFLEYKTLKEQLLPEGIEFVEFSDFIEKLRMIKSRHEISLIKKSIRVSAKCFEFIREIFDDQMSEKKLSIELEKFLRLNSDNEIAFSSIVACGKNTVFAHHHPGLQQIGDNFFLIDLGSKYYGYCADLTRVFFGSKMPLLFRRIYSLIKKAQDLAIQKIKDGVKACEVDQAAREFIDKKGYSNCFGHGLGHGIGLSVHEPPYLRPNNHEVLREGMVLTIEPAIYLRHKFGIRLEDMILVTKTKGEVLSGNIHR